MLIKLKDCKSAVARALQNGPANMTDRINSTVVHRKAKRRWKEIKHGVISLKQVLTIDHKNCITSNSTIVKQRR